MGSRMDPGGGTSPRAQKLAAIGTRPPVLQNLEEIFNWTSEAKFEMPCQRRDSCAHQSGAGTASATPARTRKPVKNIEDTW